MSVFASQFERTIPVPHDAPHEVTIRKLSGQQFEKAARAALQTTMRNMQELGGGAFMKELKALVSDEKALKDAAASVKTDEFDSLDHDLLLRFGVKAWTYDVPVDETTLADLDADTRDWLARQIYAISKRRSPEAVKND